MKKRLAPAFSAALCVAAALLARAALAGDMAGAEALFREGRALWNAGDHAGACAKFAESQRLDPSPGALLNLGKCQADDGNVATAWAEFISASELATARGDALQAAEAKQRAADLAARLPNLTITVDGAPAGLVVHRDDVVLESGSLGSPLPVDPGTHHVVATAKGFAAASLDVTLAEGEARTVTIPPLTPEAAPVPVRHLPPLHADAVAAPRSSDALLGWVVGGSGVAFAATSGVLFALSVSADHTAQKGCVKDGHWGCSTSALAAGKERDTLSTIATVSGSVGAVGIGVGLYLLLRPAFAPSGVKAAQPFIVPEVSSRGAALTVRESFE